MHLYLIGMNMLRIATSTVAVWFTLYESICLGGQQQPLPADSSAPAISSSPPDRSHHVRKALPQDLAPSGKSAVPSGVIVGKHSTPVAPQDCPKTSSSHLG